MRGPVEYGTVVECELSSSTNRVLKVSPPVDPETQEMVDNLARFVAESGPEVEAIAAERNRDNPAFRSVICGTLVFYFNPLRADFLLNTVTLQVSYYHSSSCYATLYINNQFCLFAICNS